MERSGDKVMRSHEYDEAHKYYSTALSIHPVNTPGFFILQSKVCMAKGSSEDPINAVNQVRQCYFVWIHYCRR